MYREDFCGDRQEVCFAVEPARTTAEEGAVYFELVTRSGPLTLESGEWLADGGAARRVGLVAGFCTHNRPAALLANLRALLNDTGVAERLLRIVVVDQGSARIRDHPDFALLPNGFDKVHLVEQDNYGGSGGFTRAILETAALQGASHILLMDDDAVVEPESVLRTAAFLALARQDLAVGGQMLDSLYPSRLAEFTTRLVPEKFRIETAIGDLDVAQSAGLRPMLKVEATDYSGWWFFAFPLSAVDQVGLPLPFFIHYDDVEFGLRLTRGGVPIVNVPGFGVWHDSAGLRWRHLDRVLRPPQRAGDPWATPGHSGLVPFPANRQAIARGIAGAGLFRRVGDVRGGARLPAGPGNPRERPARPSSPHPPGSPGTEGGDTAARTISAARDLRPSTSTNFLLEARI